MLKRFSLAKKITGGFTIILILLIVLAFVGRVGLTRVVEKVNSANQFQVMVDHILDARQNEKRFILTNDPQARDSLVKDIAILKNQAKDIVQRPCEKEVKNQAEKIIKISEIYAKAFDEYVALANTNAGHMADMNKKASAALDITAGIRDLQKAKYEALKEESETKIYQMRQRVLYADRIKDNFLRANGPRMVMAEAKNITISRMTEWKGFHDVIKRDLEKIKPLMHEPIAKQRHEKILSTQKELVENAKLFFKDKNHEHNLALIRSVDAMRLATVAFQQEMQELLDFYIEDIQIFSDQIMVLSSGADQIAKILLTTRILEKEFIRIKDETLFQQIIKNIDSIANVITNIKEKIDDEGKTKALDGIQDAVNVYINSFKACAELMKTENTIKVQMETAAAEITDICLQSKDAMHNQMQAQILSSKSSITIVSLCAIIFGVLIALVLARIIIRPIKRVAAALKAISQGDGDLTQRIEIDTRDEIGELARWFNAFISRLNTIIVEIGLNSEIVTASSGELLVVSENMAEDSENLALRSQAVVSAAREMSLTMSSVAATSEQASTNLRAVADSAGQMKLTLNEVAQNCERARTVSDNAAIKVQTASERVEKLGSSARDINQVTELITDIAAQTNLLALNATIEAARAGEAGKGFAVVAGEIKGLAAQTSGATLEINKKIKEIQDSTSGTVNDVKEITRVISEVTDIVSAIAASVEEQSLSAAKVSENIDQTSNGINEVNGNIAHTSQVSTRITGDLDTANGLSEKMNARSGQMKKSARELSLISGQLRDMIGVFKVNVDHTGIDSRPDMNDSAGYPYDGEIYDLMPWGDNLKLGIKQVDDQHRELVKMINELHRAMKMKLGTKQSGKILAKLADYTVYHFKHEEELFDKYNYPDRIDHKKIHEKLVDKVVGFKAEFHEGRVALSMDLMDFLTDWLRNHIMKTDKAYAPFLIEKGVD